MSVKMADMVPIAFCIGDLDTVKQAALLYDWVFPVPFEAVENEERDTCTSSQLMRAIREHVPTQAFADLALPINAMIDSENPEYFAGHRFRASFLALFLMTGVLAGQARNSRSVDSAHFMGHLAKLREFGINPHLVFPRNSIGVDQLDPLDITAVVAGMNLIDTSKASWEQILEVRRNEEARRRLRDMRLFLEKNYTGKSRQFVQDEIGSRVDQYDRVVKDFGFETKLAAINVVTDSKNLVALGTASLFAVIAGQPIVAAATAVSGISLEIGKMSLEIAKQRHAFSKFKREHELSYILDIENLMP